jgi:hypothetical protein
LLFARRGRDEALGVLDAARRTAAGATERSRRLVERQEEWRRATKALGEATRRWAERRQRAEEWQKRSRGEAAAAADARNHALAACEAARAQRQVVVEARKKVSAELVAAAEAAEHRLVEASRRATVVETEAQCAAERAERYFAALTTP